MVRSLLKILQTEPGGGRDRDGVRQDPPDLIEALQRQDRVLHRIPNRLPRAGTPDNLIDPVPLSTLHLKHSKCLDHLLR